MAEERCTSCGKLVRDESKDCPFCAAPLDGEKINERSSRTNRIFIAIIFGALFFIGAFTFLLSPVNGNLLSAKTMPGIVMMIVAIVGIIMSFTWRKK